MPSYVTVLTEEQALLLAQWISQGRPAVDPLRVGATAQRVEGE